MLNLQDFINAIHKAILSANDGLANANLQLIEKYFEIIPAKSVEEVRKSLDDTLTKAMSAPKSDEALKNILDAFSEYQSKSKEANSSSPPHYRSKNVILQYPDRTSTGMEMRNINVPLIALVPVTLSEVSEVKLKVNLEILNNGNDIKVSFPSATDTKSSEPPNLLASKIATNASLEITLTPNKGTDGLQKLIEGYTQVLRSQL
jgi:hypothetical protein